MGLASYLAKRAVERVILLLIFTAFVWMLLLGIPQLIGINPALHFINPSEFLHAKNPALARKLAIECIDRGLGLNYPLGAQFFVYFVQMLTLNLGVCPANHVSVAACLLSALPFTVILTIPPVIFQTLASIYLGSIAAVKRNTKTDVAIMNYFIADYNLPIFVVTLLLWLAFAVILKVYPISVYNQVHDWTNIVTDLKVFWLPWIILTFIYGFSTRGILMRNSMVENLDSDFIKYERLAGLKERIVRAHARRVSIIPVIVRTAIDLAFAISGDFFLEVYFGIPGLGYKLFYAALGDQIKILLGSTFVLTLYAVMLLYFVDVVEFIIDPRARRSIK
ncbi:ABC transporter permease [Acidianus sp. HS-5]|uniref:ABC transporter permease n=1 Tax=Acidianus sp. HS-5 TaxID=2886040 RepID=UPI001F33F841|nr:ABC transporter permease [Acidianus sp. HS-5]BDC18555.1 peptide ABC transporter permease [Acidianus sp. HS-5]